MDAAAFQLNKVRRLIHTQGQRFTFERPALNDFGEPNGQAELITISGVFHETSSYVSKQKVESTTIRSKSSPMILCLWQDALLLQGTDVLRYNGKFYVVTEVKNIAESNVAADLSLEEVQTDGRIST